MEIRTAIHKLLLRTCLLIFAQVFSFGLAASGQGAVRNYSIVDGGMQITLSKNISATDLAAFIKQYDLAALALPQSLSSNFMDSILAQGWQVSLSNRDVLVIRKPLGAVANINDPAQMFLVGRAASAGDNTVPMAGRRFGANSLHVASALVIKDSVATFFLRNYKGGQNVRLAGNFTDWADNALPMVLTDSGRIARVKLPPGKYTYKYMADGEWFTDPGNRNTENDGNGNDNSVFYMPNTTFHLNGFTNAKEVYLAGSFNDWREKDLRLQRSPGGWELPVYLQNGTYTYRYIVDGQWMIDPENPAKAPNEFEDVNSVISIGDPVVFRLEGAPNAKKVFLTGSFNDWRAYELPMAPVRGGWEASYVLGAGNHEFKIIADGRTLNSAGRPVAADEPGDVVVIEANHTFRLGGHANAKQVYVAGDFNGWSSNAYPMKKQGDTWVTDIHLSAGKHLYKFIVDGEWLLDPANKLWEQNEFDTGNSIIWVE